MAVKWYEIDMRFTWTDPQGKTGEGTLNGRVRGKPAVKRQLEANREWLKAHGHTETRHTITEVDGPRSPMTFAKE